MRQNTHTETHITICPTAVVNGKGGGRVLHLRGLKQVNTPERVSLQLLLILLPDLGNFQMNFLCPFDIQHHTPTAIFLLSKSLQQSLLVQTHPQPTQPSSYTPNHRSRFHISPSLYPTTVFLTHTSELHNVDVSLLKLTKVISARGTETETFYAFLVFFFSCYELLLYAQFVLAGVNPGLVGFLIPVSWAVIKYNKHVCE